MTRDEIKKLNSNMAALAIVNQATMSEAGIRVLTIACRNGGYVEAGTGAHGGHVERISAQAILALVRGGYLVHCYGSEGHVAGRLSARSIERLVEASK